MKSTTITVGDDTYSLTLSQPRSWQSNDRGYQFFVGRGESTVAAGRVSDGALRYDRLAVPSLPRQVTRALLELAGFDPGPERERDRRAREREQDRLEPHPNGKPAVSMHRRQSAPEGPAAEPAPAAPAKSKRRRRSTED